MNSTSLTDIKTLTLRFPDPGELVWIGVRPARRQSIVSVKEIWVDPETGLAGDHYAGRSKNRQVTLFQWEYLMMLESFLGKRVMPEQLRRNLLVKGINLFALKTQTFRIGDAVFKTTGLCHPCSRMENELGYGGYNAMRNHGGITAEVIQGGLIKTGDAVSSLAGLSDSKISGNMKSM